MDCCWIWYLYLLLCFANLYKISIKFSQRRKKEIIMCWINWLSLSICGIGNIFQPNARGNIFFKNVLLPSLQCHLSMPPFEFWVTIFFAFERQTYKRIVRTFGCHDVGNWTRTLCVIIMHASWWGFWKGSIVHSNVQRKALTNCKVQRQ